MNILVTSMGGDIAQSAIRILREAYPEFKIIGIDALAQPYFSKTVDEFYVSPSAFEKKFKNWIDKLCMEKKIDLVIPFSESEISILNSKGGIETPKVLTANNKSVEIGLDKLETNKYLLGLGNFAPTLYDSPYDNRIKFPVIIKERFGSGSKKVQTCSSFNQLNFYFGQMKNPIIQELLSPQDEEVTCAIYRFKNGEIRVIQLHRKLSGGRTLWASVISNKQIQNLCNLIASDIQLTGAINAQLIITSEGPKIFEINPRYSSTVEMRHAIGFSDLVWAVDEYFGYEQRSYLKPSIGVIVGRKDQIVVLDF